MKKSVAIVGFAQSTLVYAKDSKADEMWTVNFAWNYDVPRIDRLFEIHPLWQLALFRDERDRKHVKWLQKKHDFPIYTDEDYTKEVVYSLQNQNGEFVDASLDKALKRKIRIPNSVRYPFEESYKLFALLHRENNIGQPYFTNTIAYMVALAIMEGFERIEIYGVEMANQPGGALGTEYGYQKGCLEFFLGLAQGKGIEVYLPEHCHLLNAKLYHKGANMISRQTIENHIKKYEQNQTDMLGQNNYWRGQVAALEKEGGKEKEIEETETKIRKTHEGAFIANAGIQICRNMLKDIDIENPLIELINPFGFIDPNRKEDKNGRPNKIKRTGRKRKKSKRKSL